MLFTFAGRDGWKVDVVGIIDVYFLKWVVGSSYHDILGLLG